MKPTIALFLHQPKASVQCGNAMIAALDQYYRIKIFTRHDIEKDFFNNVDIVAFPGGEGDSESYHYLMKHHAPRIRNYVAQGGRYLGICMGAYWAGSHYFDILDGVDAVQYITRPDTDTRRPHAKACAVNWQGESMKMYFYDGCALVGDHRKFETVATYVQWRRHGHISRSHGPDWLSSRKRTVLVQHAQLHAAALSHGLPSSTAVGLHKRIDETLINTCLGGLNHETEKATRSTVQGLRRPRCQKD
jgi:hypothetical protein